MPLKVCSNEWIRHHCRHGIIKKSHEPGITSQFSEKNGIVRSFHRQYQSAQFLSLIIWSLWENVRKWNVFFNWRLQLAIKPWKYVQCYRVVSCWAQRNNLKLRWRCLHTQNCVLRENGDLTCTSDKSHSGLCRFFSGCLCQRAINPIAFAGVSLWMCAIHSDFPLLITSSSSTKSARSTGATECVIVFT